MPKQLAFAVLIVAALGCVGCDLAAKSLAETALRGESPRLLLGGALELRYAENTGGFLSLGARLPVPLRSVAFVVVAAGALLGIAIVAVRDASPALPRVLAVACILGGGAGNLVDRLAFGHVRDFAVLHVGPLGTGIFNVADVAVTLGCGALVVLSWRSGRSRGRR